MLSSAKRLYVFGWPSFLGGADTKLAHLLILLKGRLPITVVPNDAHHLRNRHWTAFLKKLKIDFCLFGKLPRKLEGWALSLSNQRFFTDGICKKAKERGLQIIWSSEMMWHHEGELEAVHAGLVDKVLYVSELQKSWLEEGYGGLPGVMTGNYIDPDYFPFIERKNRNFTIGRLSRAAAEKYPEDFPVFYEGLGLPEARYRVMAWDQALRDKYRWHKFGPEWDLLDSEAEGQVDFLHSLDLFVYPLGHNFRESWGRSTVEAMLTGCIPVVQKGHHLDNLIIHGETGYICNDFLEYREHTQRLCADYEFRKKMSARCRDHAANTICNREQHLKLWLELFQ